MRLVEGLEREPVYAHDQRSEIVVRAGSERGIHDRFCAAFEVLVATGEQFAQIGAGQDAVHAIGSEQDAVAFLQFQRMVINLQMAVRAECAGEVFAAAFGEGVVAGDLLEQFAAHVMDARIAGVKTVKRVRFCNHRREGGEHAVLSRIARRILAVDPAVETLQHLGGGVAGAPGGRGAEVVGDEDGGGHLARHL